MRTSKTNEISHVNTNQRQRNLASTPKTTTMREHESLRKKEEERKEESSSPSPCLRLEPSYGSPAWWRYRFLDVAERQAATRGEHRKALAFEQSLVSHHRECTKTEKDIQEARRDCRHDEEVLTRLAAMYGFRLVSVNCKEDDDEEGKEKEREIEGLEEEREKLPPRTVSEARPASARKDLSPPRNDENLPNRHRVSNLRRDRPSLRIRITNCGHILSATKKAKTSHQNKKESDGPNEDDQTETKEHKKDESLQPPKKPLLYDSPHMPLKKRPVQPQEVHTDRHVVTPPLGENEPHGETKQQDTSVHKHKKANEKRVRKMHLDSADRINHAGSPSPAPERKPSARKRSHAALVATPSVDTTPMVDPFPHVPRNARFL